MKKLIFGLAFAAAVVFAAPATMAQTADFCTNVKSLTKMAATNFAEVKGELNEEETEIEEEDVFFSTLSIEGFEHANILPTFSPGKLKIQYFTFVPEEGQADLLLKEMKTKLDGCLNVAAGFKGRVDSDIYFYESTTVTLQLMRSSDFDDEGNTIYKVLMQMNKR